MKIFHPTITGSLDISGSINVTGGQLNGTSSYALTASYAMNGGGGGGGTPSGSNTQIQYNNNGAFGGVPTLVYSGGLLSITGSFSGSINGTITTAATASYAVTFAIDETLIDFSKYASTIVGSNNMFQQATGSWTSAHCRYTVYKGANSRAGEFVTSWNDGVTSYYDNATVDIGNTSDIVFSSAIVTSQLQINAVAASSAWTVKMLATFI